MAGTEHATETETTGRTTSTVVLGGLVGGLAGAVVFAGLMYLLNPGFLDTTVPAMYGLEPQNPLGWVVHFVHGAVLGVLFGLIVSRPIVTDVLLPDHDPEEIGPEGTTSRLTTAGLAYGLAIWAILPMIVMPVWLGAVGGEQLQEVPATAVESLVGHAGFGVVLGAVYAAVVTRR